MPDKVQTSTLRPGLLVSLKTSVRGNVNYAKREIESNHTTEDGKSKAKWETTRTIFDPKEHEDALKVRGRARSLISGVCSASAFGMLCPENAKDALDEAMREARKIAEDFNKTAKLTRVFVNVIAGRVADDDGEAIAAINGELRELLSDMERGVEGSDVKAIREAASKAKDLSQMLNPDAAARVQIAVDAGRKVAKEIVAADGTLPVNKRAIDTIREQKSAFLDMSDGEVASPETQGRAIDMDAA